MNIPPNLSPTQKLVASFYKDEKGDPIILSPAQDLIFQSIAQKLHPRNHIMCYTRFGKSFTVGLAVLTRAASYPEKWAIIAGTKPKARIIMDYVIRHIFDNDYTRDRFIPDKGEKMEDLMRYRNKNHVTFKVDVSPDGKPLIGEVYIGAAQDALGFGAPNVVLDEAALIDDTNFSLVLRMLGDNPAHNFLAKIGNPFNRNHFLQSYHDPNYHKIIINCYQGLKEGRITQDIIEENRRYAFFKILYECMFPSANEIDEAGWMSLLTDLEITKAQKRELEPSGKRRLGVDVARSGRNYNAWVLRWDNVAQVLRKDLDDNLHSTAETTKNLAHENGVLPEDVYVDDTGVGGGVTDILKSANFTITPVNFGSSASEKEYANVRAEMYAGNDGLAHWVRSVGQLVPHKDWIELTKIRYKKDMSGRTKIEPKDEMRKRGIESPDVADALCLTFAPMTKKQYHGIDPAKVLAGGGSNLFGGVQPLYDDMPG